MTADHECLVGDHFAPVDTGTSYRTVRGRFGSVRVIIYGLEKLS